jgi:dihydrodipicolinate synthase/N-acetylneuraminate lyase
LVASVVAAAGAPGVICDDGNALGLGVICGDGNSLALAWLLGASGALWAAAYAALAVHAASSAYAKAARPTKARHRKTNCLETPFTRARVTKRGTPGTRLGSQLKWRSVGVC